MKRPTLGEFLRSDLGKAKARSMMRNLLSRVDSLDQDPLQAPGEPREDSGLYGVPYALKILQSNIAVSLPHE